MATLQPILRSFPSHPPPNLPSISLLPLSIAHDGPAKISTYFITRPAPPSSSPSSSILPEGQVPLESAFRGRLVLSTPVGLPDGYTGLIFSTSTSSPSTTTTTTTTTAPNSGTNANTNKRIKLDGNANAPVAGGSRGTGGKAAKPLLSRPKGRTRTSPRKSVQVRYSMDSDEDEGENAKEEEGENAVMRLAKARDSTPPPVKAPPTLSLSTPTGTSKVLDTLPEENQTAEVVSPTPSPIAEVEVVSAPVVRKQEVEVEVGVQLEEEEGLAPDEQLLIPYATFSSIQIYNPDMPLDLQEDVYARSLLEWVGIAQKIHAY